LPFRTYDGLNQGESDKIRFFDLEGLAPGRHTATITVFMPEATNSPANSTYTLVRMERVRGISGDFDGDGSSDLGFYYPANGGWYIRAETKGSWEDQFGFEGTLPVTGDYDGDGQADLGCYHPPSGMWYRMMSSVGFRTTQFGFDGTVPF
jgi:hypothetical protein